MDVLNSKCVIDGCFHIYSVGRSAFTGGRGAFAWVFSLALSLCVFLLLHALLLLD